MTKQGICGAYQSVDVLACGKSPAVVWLLPADHVGAVLVMDAYENLPQLVVHSVRVRASVQLLRLGNVVAWTCDDRQEKPLDVG